MAIMLQLEYDELRAIAKQFRDSGEDITNLYGKTNDRTQNLRGMWKGDAADKFFEEMELELLPKLKQTGHVLFSMQDVLLRVIKYVIDADMETANFFKQDVGITGGFVTAGIAGVVTGGIAGGQVGFGSKPRVGNLSDQQGKGSASSGAATGAASAGGSSASGATGSGSQGGNQSPSPQSDSAKGGQAGSAGSSNQGTGGGNQGWAGRSGSSTGVSAQGVKMGASTSQGQPLNSPLQPDHIYESSTGGAMPQAGTQQAVGSAANTAQHQEVGKAAGIAATSAASVAGLAAAGKAGLGLKKGQKIPKSD